MKTFKQFLLENSKLLKEEPSINSNKTGLNTKIYLDHECDVKSSHNGPRLKFEDPDTKKLIPLEIRDDSKDEEVFKKSFVNRYEKCLKLIKEIRKWIKLNLTILLKYWSSTDKEYNLEQFRKDMKKLK